MSKKNLINSIGKRTGNYLDGIDRAIEENKKHDELSDVCRFSELDEQIQEQVVERMAEKYLTTDYWYRPIQQHLFMVCWKTKTKLAAISKPH